MHKLTLKIDELQVESFTTSRQARAYGTVHAHSATNEPNETYTCPAYWTGDCTWDCDSQGGPTEGDCFSGGMNNCTTRFEN